MAVRGAAAAGSGRRVAPSIGALLVASLLAAGAAPAQDAPRDPRRLDYETLQHWRCGASLPVPAGGVEMVRDVATLRFDAGSFRLLEPTADGRRTGFVFEGSGRFSMTVPDPVEVRQLARFSGHPERTGVETTFRRLVLRTVEPLPPALLRPGAESGPWTDCPLARERQENWLLYRDTDADARVVAGLETPGDEYLRFEMETADYGWLTFTFDGQADEEIQLARYTTQAGGPFVESWLALDRAEDRRPDGRPSALRRRPVVLTRVEAAIDLTRPGRDALQGRSRTNAVDVEIEATLVLAARQASGRAVRLQLHPEAEVRRVVDASGLPLAFLRDATGRRSATLHDWLSDAGLVVLLDRPLAAGEERRITVAYRLDLDNYAPGRVWYPWVAEDVAALHTARLEITALEKLAVRAMGATRLEPAGRGRTRLVAEIDRPTTMVTFSFAEQPREVTVTAGAGDGAIAVTTFATRTGTSSAALHDVAADVANAVQFFEQLYGVRLADRRLVAVSILGSHGQSFDGFLHLADATFYEERRGPTELFRAHEVAHQIFGHRVRCAGYRDQWLAEAFAEYSGLLFVEATVPDGPALVREALGVDAAILQGSLRSLGSRFARPSLLELNPQHRGRIGPIALGYRAATAEVPRAYELQSYYRGTWALHMLRELLRRQSGSDELFIAVLRDFVRDFDGREATTTDFAACLARRAPGDWRWFFDQWIDGAEIPTYAWRYSVAAGADGKPHLRLTVRQRGVGDGFRMPVPVAVELPGSARGDLVMLVDRAEQSLDAPLPARPSRVTFNPGGAVLAVVEKD